MSKFETQQPMSEMKLVKEAASDFLRGAHAEAFHAEAMQSMVNVFDAKEIRQPRVMVVQSETQKETVAA